ncbi:hypothetical protein KKB69_00570, partial [Patescibacteria group bacterium]|nr:hypothetical protein [Patescibacteria group bacterium]
LVNAILCLAIWRLSPSWWGIAGIFGSLFWFGYKGIKKIEIGWKGVPLILGGRLPEFLKDFLFKEGYIWTLPKPFMGCGVQDCRETPEKEFVVEELSQDRMAVKVEVAAQAKVVDPYRAFDVSDYVTSLKELTERVIRWSIVEDEAIDVPDKKRDLSIKIEREARKISVPRWGLNVIQIYVKGVRLPPELEKALAQKKIEQVQAESEETEIKNVRNLVNIMKEGTNLSYNQAANIVQSERGKIKRTVVEGNAGDFTKGAALGQKGDKE